MLSRSFTGPSIDASGSAFMNEISPTAAGALSHDLSRCTCASRAAPRTLRFRCRHCTGIGCAASCRVARRSEVCSYSRLHDWTQFYSFRAFLLLYFFFFLFFFFLSLENYFYARTRNVFKRLSQSHGLTLIKFEIDLIDTRCSVICIHDLIYVVYIRMICRVYLVIILCNM